MVTVMRSSNILLNKSGDIKFCDLSLLVQSIENITNPVIRSDTYYKAFYVAVSDDLTCTVYWELQWDLL